MFQCTFVFVLFIYFLLVVIYRTITQFFSNNYKQQLIARFISLIFSYNYFAKSANQVKYKHDQNKNFVNLTLRWDGIQSSVFSLCCNKICLCQPDTCFFLFCDPYKMIYVMVNENEWDMMMSVAKQRSIQLHKFFSSAD